MKASWLTAKGPALVLMTNLQVASKQGLATMKALNFSCLQFDGANAIILLLALMKLT